MHVCFVNMTLAIKGNQLELSQVLLQQHAVYGSMQYKLLIEQN